MMAAQGMFITLEGGEGTGKSTQIKLLSAYLQAQGIAHITTREPGGTPQADTLRELLLSGEGERWQPLSELMLYSAARAEHLHHVVGPALAAGNWVLCDRFADSTTVYQARNGLPLGQIEAVHNIIVGETWPHKTIILDMPVSQSLCRGRGSAPHEQRFENMADDFHEYVRSAFLKLAQQHTQRCVVIDASGSKQAVHQRILDALAPLLKNEAA